MAATTKLYVGNLAWATTQDDLYQLFSKFGNVSDTFIATERETGRSRGFGFVTMNSEEANAAANSLNNSDFMGRTIRVNEAQPPGERGAGGGGFGAPRRGGYNGGGGGYGGGGGGGWGNGGGGGWQGGGGYGQQGGYGGGYPQQGGGYPQQGGGYGGGYPQQGGGYGRY